MRCGGRTCWALLLAALAAWATLAATASAAPRLVTYAARTCPHYTDITANLARNNIQESLRDLGDDTVYVAGEPISPAKEQTNQPACTPITDWRFTLGTGYQTRAVNGPWGSLSKVLNPYGTQIVTKASTPLLDANGSATGLQISGAVTVPLTDEQATRATTPNSLWVQGGAVDDPVLDTVFPGTYGFAALRCGIDNLNGDNVEWIAYPQGASHVFCFAYYVTPPPSSGTIIVRKVVDDPAATATQVFPFVGNISYTSDQTFSIPARSGQPGSMTFVRGAVGPRDVPWSFTEKPTPGWELTGLGCTSATGGSVTSASSATGRAVVQLAAGDTVTCTYTNRLEPPPAGLVLSKTTLGGVGGFDFTVSGDGTTHSQRITTTDPGVARAGAPLTLTAGPYRIAEELPPPGPSGRWRRTAAVCDGKAFPVHRPIELTLVAGAGSACQFTNALVPPGSLSLSKVTFGGVGTVGFEIRPVRGPARSFEQSATTTVPGEPVRATGDPTTHLRLGLYEITETGAPPTAQGSWQQESVVCNGAPTASAQGRIRVLLTASRPAVECTFANRLVPGPEPPVPPTPPPAGGGDGSVTEADGPFADISVTKTVSPRVATPGAPVRYTVTVANRGPDPAEDVVATELQPRGSRTLRVATTRGTCSGVRPAHCRIGTLAAGERAVITIVSTAGDPGRHVNVVAVLSSTRDTRLTDNRAAAVLLVRQPLGPRFTG